MKKAASKAKATRGVVVCPQPLAADVGAAVLASGGNAFDAAIATAFAQMVADPFMCGLGGMGTLQYFRPDGAPDSSAESAADSASESGADFRADSGEHGMIDFHNRAGSKVAPDMWEGNIRGLTEVSKYVVLDSLQNEIGYGSIMTPGTVAGFYELHRRLASKPWDELLAPAARLAREGLELPPFVVEFWHRPPQPGMPGAITRISASEACKKIFLPEGRLFEAGELLRNPDMAGTIDRIGKGGADEFYRGGLSAEIAGDLEANGAYVTAEDLAGYEVRGGEPLRGSYRGFTVASNPPPGGGPCIIEMLHILENFDLRAMGHGSAGHLDLVARAMSAGHVDRETWLGDPEFGDVPVERLISKDHAAHWAGKIKAGAFPRLDQEMPPSCTTHLSIYDEAGNAVSCTHTLGYGSGMVTPGLGFVYNNSMSLFDAVSGRPNSIAPGKARNTAMAPTMLLDAQGKPFIIVGAPGSSVIISSVLQTIINIVDFGMSAVEAVSAPRIHCEGGALHTEARVEGRVCGELAAMGHEVKRRSISYDPAMARAHVVLIKDGRWQGGADPRGGGGVAYSL